MSLDSKMQRAKDNSYLYGILSVFSVGACVYNVLNEEYLYATMVGFVTLGSLIVAVADHKDYRRLRQEKELTDSLSKYK
ncbi:MAG: hypothetical protein ABIF40_00480 [archaeon]